MNLKDIVSILPENIKTEVQAIKQLDLLEEIRLKVYKPLQFQIKSKNIVRQYLCTPEDISTFLQRISNYSLYAFEEELKQGYITIKGGHRVGLCGTCVLEQGRIKTIKNIASVNIRIGREVKGCSKKIWGEIISDGVLSNTLIVSPPGCGKTTLLRDMCRELSEGISEFCVDGKKVCVIDERSEIAACSKGIPQFDVGIRTDVLDGCPKNEGIMMAIRSLSPDIIICDEIGTPKDVESLLMACNAGVILIASIHGYSLRDIFRRAVFKELMENQVFKKVVILSSAHGPGTIENIYDLSEKLLVRGADVIEAAI